MTTLGTGSRRRRRIIIALGLGLGMALASPAWADVKDGVDAWDRGDFAAAVAQWQGPAAKGDPDAMFNMGQAYKLGRGVPKDPHKAEELYARAAQKGHIRAADNYGILLFQTGRQKQALPWLVASSDRGEPRAMYILAIAAYNGDYVVQDPVRAYALMTRAAQAGLQQAVTSLASMNEALPLDQRQQGAALAQELDHKSAATRSSEMGAADLGNAPDAAAAAPPPPAMIARADDVPQQNVTPDPPQGAGTEYARPRQPATAPPRLAVRSERPTYAPPAHDSGGWRIQFGAFAQKANADALWAKVRSRPEVAGHARIDASGSVTRLMAGGYSQSGAQAACTRLKAAGVACLVVNR